MYLLKARNMSLPLNSYAPYGYDTLWTVALALDKAATILASRNQTLQDFNYKNKEIAMIIHGLVAKTNFTGMSVSAGCIIYHYCVVKGRGSLIEDLR